MHNKTRSNQYIIADHFRACCFIISDGVLPSGKQRGYILRRLMRRLFSASLKLKIDILNPQYYQDLLAAVLAIYGDVYQELQANQDLILQIFTEEAKKYQKAIEVGKREWQKILAKSSSRTI